MISLPRAALVGADLIPPGWTWLQSQCAVFLERSVCNSPRFFPGRAIFLEYAAGDRSGLLLRRSVFPDPLFCRNLGYCFPTQASVPDFATFRRSRSRPWRSPGRSVELQRSSRLTLMARSTIHLGLCAGLWARLLSERSIHIVFSSRFGPSPLPDRTIHIVSDSRSRFRLFSLSTKPDTVLLFEL